MKNKNDEGRKNSRKETQDVSLPIGRGVIALALLVAFYFATLTLLINFSYAVDQFFTYWYLMIPLVLGFGAQVTLYSYLTGFPKGHAGGASLAASGSVSGVSMVACCLHLLAPLIPLIGFSGAMIFLSEYSVGFLVLGLFSSLLGVFIMLGIVRKCSLHTYNRLLRGLSGSDVRLGKSAVVILAVIIVPLAFLMGGGHMAGAFPEGTQSQDSQLLVLEKISKTAGGLIVAVEPELMGDGSIIFSASFDTHQGDLDFNVDDVAVLRDDSGNEYQADSWNGDSPGGHHRSGQLTFSGIDSDATSLTLIIRDVYGVSERTFEWEVNT